MSAGRVEIGAFRTYPADYTPPEAKDSEWQYIPRDRIEEFGVHAKMFYKMDVQIFKSSLDTKLFNLLWNKYWVKTLSSSSNHSVRLPSLVIASSYLLTFPRTVTSPPRRSRILP